MVWDRNIEGTKFIDCIWNIPWNYSTRPPAFPEQIVNQLIDIYSLEGDVVWIRLWGKQLHLCVLLRKAESSLLMN